MSTKIEWVDETWNPWAGCKKISSECDNCYMYRLLLSNDEDPEKIVAASDLHFNKPDSVKSGSFIFTCSMSDFFFDYKPLECLRLAVWSIIKSNRDKIFIILTKRPENIEKMLPVDWGSGYKNVILGITAGNQLMFDRRYMYLKRNPAVCYLVSHEPALGFITYPQDFLNLRNKAWVIAGGETGLSARPSHLFYFVKDLNQCEANGVPFFFKHWGEWIHGEQKEDGKTYLNDGRLIVPYIEKFIWPGHGESYRIGRKFTGNFLNGKQYQQYPNITIEKQQLSFF